MYWRKYPEQDPLSRENLETAVRLYASSFSFSEEEKWLAIIENALRTGLVFTASDICEDTRGERKKRHHATLSRLQERIRQRQNREISKFELAQELREICNLPFGHEGLVAARSERS